MAKPTLSSLGTLLRDRREDKGLREVANEIGVSSATLSRVENGKLPDLGTFAKLCRWLQLDPTEMLGCEIPDTTSNQQEENVFYAHLRADQNQEQEMANALGAMIVAAQRMMTNRVR